MLFLRVDALGIVSHLCFPAAGGAFVAPRPAPDPGVEVGWRVGAGVVCGVPSAFSLPKRHSLSFELFKTLGVEPQVHELSLLPNTS